VNDAQNLAPPAGVYESACADYFLAGWKCVIPVPPEAKFPPPGGFTGADGRDTAPEDIADWAEQQPGASIALRMPDGVIGIDVDEYVKGGAAKHGAATLAARITEWGVLPPTYSSTARGQGQPSRIWFFRVPPRRYAAQLGPDAEIIQRHHRYAVVAPSPHYETGTAYAWYGPDGVRLEGRVPRPGELAALPESWVAGLAEGAAAPSPAAASPGEAGQLLDYLNAEAGQVCTDMAHAAAAALAEVTAVQPGSRHDLMTRSIYELVQLSAEGHGGYGTVIAQLETLWNEMTAGEGRDRHAEFTEMITTAARKAVTAHGAVPQATDPCRVFGRGLPRFAPPAPDVPPGTDDDELPPPPEEPQSWSPWGDDGIGITPFDPQSGLDGMLGREVLGRTWPVLRYAPDAGAWIRRGPGKWDVIKGDLAKWGVDLVSVLMPPGDPDAAQGSPPRLQAERRKRFMSNTSANAVAGKMNAQVAAGQHPSAVELAALDTEREILWAGGRPYDLRNSDQGPAVSRWTDPGTPHLHSAGVVPELRPVPLWETFLAAVWPDAAVRAWALRILAISFTGYSDKALPILLGDTDKGKTSILMLLMSVLGSYAHVADARLLAPADRSHASIVYALRGRRLSFIDEAPRTGSLATERLKQITGGADLTGNRMGENPITFPTTHTLILTANPEHEPVLTDAAIRRRVRLIPCDGNPGAVRAARAAIGAEHGAPWRAEAPGVLALMMIEAARWLADPHSAGNEAAPDSAAQAALEIMTSQDLVLSWLREECEDSGRGTRSRDLYRAFTESCRSMQVNPATMPSETRWGRRLTELGYPPYKRTDANYRFLRIRPPQVFMPGPAALSGASGGSARPHGGSEPENGGFMDGSGPSPQPSMNGNTAGQTIHETIHMEGMEGKSTFIAHTRAHTHTHTHTHMQGGKGSTPHTPHPSIEPVPDPPAAENPGSSLAVTSPAVTEPAAGTAKARAQLRKAAEKAAKLAAAEGPVHQLPVIVARDPAGGPPLVVPCTPDEAVLLASQYLDGLCVDVEHTGFGPGRVEYKLRLIQAGGEHVAAVFDPDDPAQAEAVRGLLAQARTLHAHSAIADLIPLAWAGLADADSLWDRMVDSVLIAKLADPALAGSDESQLKKLSADLLGPYAVSPPAEVAKNALFKTGGWLVETKPQTPLERSGWAQVRKNCETFLRYAGSDVLDLAAVLRVLPRPPAG
jgi:phage/plasmid-associated DNA primase